MFLSVAGFIYTIILSIIFFRKEKIETNEIKIYKILIINTLFSLISELIIMLMIVLNKLNFVNVAMRIYLICILLWTSVFTLYVFSLSHNELLDKMRLKKQNIIYFRIYFFISLVFSIIIFLLPIGLYHDVSSSIAYSYGKSVEFLFTISGIYLLIMIILVMLDRKNIRKKGYIPVVALIILLIISALIQKANPSILLINFVYSITIFLMYHTIENPDVKMLQEVTVAKKQAEQANQAKTDFLSNMSHEIRTPLNAIVGFSSVIENADNLEEAKTNAKDIVDASNTLLEIVNGILDISKIEAGKMELVNKDYNSYELYEGCAKLINVKMQEKGLDFQVDIARDMPTTLYGDPANIKKIVVNLLSNAYKYTDKGSVKYTLSNVMINDDTCRLIISVEDTGRGIKKESIDKLFTKFQRLDEDRNTTIEGTGLGLALTKQLVEMMGGKIICQSVYGSGSKFTVILEQKIIAMNEDKTASQNINDEAPLNVKGRKILIVDDNKLNLKVAERLLREYELDITLLDSGFDCVDNIKNGNNYDLILMDDMMPKLSGTETLNRLKEINGFNIPVIALTANAISGMKEQYLSAGFDDYLAKPIEKEEMKRVLKAFVSQEKVLEPKKETNEYDINYLKSNNIDVDKGLTLFGSEEAYKKNLLEFYNKLKERVINLNQYVITEDMSNFQELVHELMASAMQLGLTKVSEIALDLDMKSKTKDVEYVKKNFNELLNELKINIVIIKKYLGK